MKKENIHQEISTGKPKERKQTRARLPKPSSQAIDPRSRSKAGRIALAKMIMKLFDLWGLNTRDQAALLGLSPSPDTARVALCLTSATFWTALRTSFRYIGRSGFYFRRIERSSTDGQQPLTSLLTGKLLWRLFEGRGFQDSLS